MALERLQALRQVSRRGVSAAENPPRVIGSFLSKHAFRATPVNRVSHICKVRPLRHASCAQTFHSLCCQRIFFLGQSATLRFTPSCRAATFLAGCIGCSSITSRTHSNISRLLLSLTESLPPAVHFGCLVSQVGVTRPPSSASFLRPFWSHQCRVACFGRFTICRQVTSPQARDFGVTYCGELRPDCRSVGLSSRFHCHTTSSD